MENKIFTVKENRPLTDSVYIIILSGETSAITAPGQFVNIALDGLYLRRPISVCDVDGGELTIIYKTVGLGTLAMSRLTPGERLDVLIGLGNGYDLSDCGDKPLLIGGGVGVPPLYLLAKRLIEMGRTPKIMLGFNTASEVFFENEFKKLGLQVNITTVDGSHGTRGFVTDALGFAGDFDYTFSCGPELMLRAVYDKCGTDGQFSFETRMGCGFGACMGCTCATKYGGKRICREGPVLKKGEILW